MSGIAPLIEIKLSFASTSPSQGGYYDPGEVFNITVEFKDIIRSQEIMGANIECRLNDTGAVFRSDIVNYIGNDLYNITIDTNDIDIRNIYGSINCSRLILKIIFHKKSAIIF